MKGLCATMLSSCFFLFKFSLRVWMLFQCFALDNVPDPANSKWAKECTQERVNMRKWIQTQVTINCSSVHGLKQCLFKTGRDDAAATAE